jgi:hypothetical protein
MLLAFGGLAVYILIHSLMYKWSLRQQRNVEGNSMGRHLMGQDGPGVGVELVKGTPSRA